jgi:uncharacterized membrane protein YhiD involved in acid resistance
VIFREVHGSRITTAATIWSAAAIGMAIAIDLYVVGVLGAIFVFTVLEARPLTRRIDDFLRRVGGELREETTERRARRPDAAARGAGEQTGRMTGGGRPVY